MEFIFARFAENAKIFRKKRGFRDLALKPR